MPLAVTSLALNVKSFTFLPSSRPGQERERAAKQISEGVHLVAGCDDFDFVGNGYLYSPLSVYDDSMPIRGTGRALTHSRARAGCNHGQEGHTEDLIAYFSSIKIIHRLSSLSSHICLFFPKMRLVPLVAASAAVRAFITSLLRPADCLGRTPSA